MAAFIYALCEPDTMEVRYVGKATNTARRLGQHICEARSRITPKDQWIYALSLRGHKPALVVLTETENWDAEERRLIAYHRLGGRLLNIADGGVGAFQSKPRPRGAFFRLMHRFQTFINSGATQFVALKAGHKAQRKLALKHVSAAEYDSWLEAHFEGNL